MFEKIKAIIEKQLGIDDPDRISMESTIADDLNADSLDAVEIIMSIEDEFDIEIPDDIAEGFRTIQDIMDYIETTR